MIRFLALALTLITGFSALVYEIAWQKFLAILLGSHAEATAIVLGLFLGGLSWGYVRFGRLSHRLAGASGDARAPLLRVYGVVEGSIGLFALAFPLLFRAVRAISVALPGGTEWLAFPVDVVLAALLVVPPAVLMGGTVPLLTQALSTSLGDATRFHAFVYGFNTAGAFLGALAAGFVLVPRLGLPGTMLALGLVNLAAGGLFLALAAGARDGAGAPPAEDNRREAASGAGPRAAGAYVLAALLVGFAMMALQTVVNRIAALSIGAAPFTFATVVACFVLGIAVGSLAVSMLREIPGWVLPLSQWALAGYLLLLYPRVADAPYGAHVIRAIFRDERALVHAYHLANLAALLLVLLVPLALAGAALPLLFHRLRHEVGDLGEIAGRIYGWNTVGALLGALLGGYALLFWVDLHHVYRLSVLAIVATATILTVRFRSRLWVAATIAAGVATVILAALPIWPELRMTSGTFRTRAPIATTFSGAEAFYDEYLFVLRDRAALFYDDDPTATVAVLKTRENSLALLINGKSDSSIPGDRLTTGLLGLLPAWLAERPRRAFVIGYGTGVTAGELASLETIEEVVVAEISPGVVRAAGLFDPLNGGASRNPKVRIVRRDAYRALERSRGTYDVIVSEPSNPWVEGVEMLYSIDFLRDARRRLAPGGVYAQWFHTYETDDDTLALVLNTYRQAFDQVAVWMGGDTDVLLLGFQGGSAPASVDELERRWARPDFEAAFRRTGVQSFPGLLTHEVLPLGVLHELDLPGAVHTLLRPRLNHGAALAFFVGGYAKLPASTDRAAAEVGARNSLLRAYHLRRGGQLPDETWEAVALEGCRVALPACATLFARWLHEHPQSVLRDQLLAEARESIPNSAAMLSATNLVRLASLFRADGTLEAEPTHAVAERVREAFQTHYDHAFPFEARALHEPWLRCTAPLCDALRDEVLATGLGP